MLSTSPQYIHSFRRPFCVNPNPIVDQRDFDEQSPFYGTISQIADTASNSSLSTYIQSDHVSAPSKKRDHLLDHHHHHVAIGTSTSAASSSPGQSARTTTSIPSQLDIDEHNPIWTFSGVHDEDAFDLDHRSYHSDDLDLDYEDDDDDDDTADYILEATLQPFRQERPHAPGSMPPALSSTSSSPPLSLSPSQSSQVSSSGRPYRHILPLQEIDHNQPPTTSQPHTSKFTSSLGNAVDARGRKLTTVTAVGRKPCEAQKYKRSSHEKRAPHAVVARRNARERRRVQAVNSAFVTLRKAVPVENHRGKRISKVKTLQNAINYIQGLQELITKSSSIMTSLSYNTCGSGIY